MSSRRRNALLLAAALLLASVAGCTGDDQPDAATAPPPDVTKAIGRALDSRARVVRPAVTANTRWESGVESP